MIFGIGNGFWVCVGGVVFLEVFVFGFGVWFLVCVVCCVVVLWLGVWCWVLFWVCGVVLGGGFCEGSSFMVGRVGVGFCFVWRGKRVWLVCGLKCCFWF